MIPPSNPRRFERLRSLTPIDAVQTWLDMAFGIGDEPAMVEAIRRDGRILLSEREIVKVMMTAMDDDLDAAATLERLAASK